jgi:polyhydroxyalkanoate synthesis regulator phasin
MKKHDRPYKCTSANCAHLKGFGSKGDLERHKITKHKQLVSTEAAASPKHPFYCPEPNCNRSSSPTNKPFARKDNLTDHMRRKHKNNLLKQGQVHTAASCNGKRRRLENSTSLSDIADSSKPTPREPQEEIEELRRKVKNLEDENKFYKKKEATLFELIEEYRK